MWKLLSKLKIHVYLDPESVLIEIYPTRDTLTYLKYSLNNYIHCRIICNKNIGKSLIVLHQENYKFDAFVHSAEFYTTIKKSEAIHVYIDINNRYRYGKISKHMKKQRGVCVSLNRNIYLYMLI